MSSPGTVSYQLKKLLNSGIITKNHKTGKYYVNKELKKGVLGFFIHIGFLMIPRFSFYLIVYLLGFMVFIALGIISDFNFITNPSSWLLLIFLIFGTGVFVFETIKIWKRRPKRFR